MDQYLNIRAKTIQLLEEKKGSKIFVALDKIDHGLLDMTPKTQVTR